MTIALREITRANWRECAGLETTPAQRHFVASNAQSLAQAAYESEWIPRAAWGHLACLAIPKASLIGD